MFSSSSLIPATLATIISNAKTPVEDVNSERAALRKFLRDRVIEVINAELSNTTANNRTAVVRFPKNNPHESVIITYLTNWLNSLGYVVVLDNSPVLFNELEISWP